MSFISFSSQKKYEKLLNSIHTLNFSAIFLLWQNPAKKIEKTL